MAQANSRIAAVDAVNTQLQQDVARAAHLVAELTSRLEELANNFAAHTAAAAQQQAVVSAQLLAIARKMGIDEAAGSGHQGAETHMGFA